MRPCIVPVLRRHPTWINNKLSIGSGIIGRVFTTSEHKKSRNELLTALHLTNLVLPRILSSSETTSWSKLIRKSRDDISGVSTRKPRIAVWGLDELSLPTELVSALLDDPLVSDKQTVDALRSRRKRNPEGVLSIGYGDLEGSISSLSLSLSWLQKHNVDIIEIPGTHPDPKALLYDSDVQVIVTSPLSTSLPRGMGSLLLNPALILILNHPTLDQRTLDITFSHLTAQSPTLSDTLRPKFFQVYPALALSALDTFRTGSNSAVAIEAFQENFLNSGVAALSRHISGILLSDREIMQLRQAQLVLSGALEACRDAVDDATRDTIAVETQIDVLHSRIEDAYSRGLTEVLGGEEAPEITEAIRKSTLQMRATIDTWKWWRIPFRADDLDHTLSRAAEHAWCRELEAKLQFQVGRLSVLRSSLTADTHACLDLLPSSFSSAVLVNTLRQISARPPDLEPTTLTYPLAYRLQQLQYPIMSLHRRVQRAVLVAVTTAFVSVGSSYAAWLLGWVTPPTAVGLAALGVVACIRWFGGNWERWKKRWWQDWRRVGEGLERDLKDTLSVIMREKVTAVPSTAAEELLKAVALRSSEIKVIEAELKTLEQSSHDLCSTTTTKRV